MADNINRTAGNSVALGALIGAAVVALAVLGYFYYERQREVVTIDVPGFSGKVTESPLSGDKDVDIKVGRD
ncbi:MAG: hypothetical protein IMZ46_16015 [Acidobacteria bacterium]|nr:hypothetical protein [Acidobacteriota bacterium]